MDYICKLCNQKVESNGHFWDNHHIKISTYFETNEPRFTKTGQKVIFKKEIDKYFETDFNDLNERRAWAKQNPELAKEYFIDLLVKRKIKKNWIYAPGQTLLSLCNLPKIVYFEGAFNKPFSEICKKLGFKIRYKNKLPEIDWNKSINIIQDTREQKGWIWPTHVKVDISKLDFGDYAISDNKNISIERKSIGDAASTFSAGYDRFKRELQRAKKARGYIVILIESSYNDFRGIEFLPQTKYIKSTYEYLSKRMRDLYEEFDNFQICFCNGRKHSVKIAEFILKSGNKVKKIDLQFLVDKKIL